MQTSFWTFRSSLVPARLRRVRTLLAGCACILLAAAAGAAPPGFDTPDDMGAGPLGVDIPVTARLSQSALVPGETAYLAVIYTVPPQHHIQINEFLFLEAAEENATDASASDSDGADADGSRAATPGSSAQLFELGMPILPQSTFEFMEEDVYVGQTVLLVPIEVDASVQPGEYRLPLVAGYQACAEEPSFVCFAPTEVDLNVPIQVTADVSEVQLVEAEYFASIREGAGGDAELGEAAAEGGSLAGRLERALRAGSVLAFIFVFLGGIGTSFTPCVYPMIPITISYIGGSSRSKAGGFFLSIFFVLGIALMYSILGIVAASTGALFGTAMQSTPVLLAVSLIFFAMGASMLGAFDLAIPSGVQRRLQSGPRTGVLGAIFMGMVTGIVASPCVGPVLVVLLTFVADVGNVAYGFFLLFVFALGLGMLFLVIGTFAGALNALPQAGQWMDTVKHVFGVILFAMGIYYVRTLLGPDLTRMAAGLLVLLVGTFLGAFRPVPADASNRLLFRKGIGIAMLLCGGLFLVVGTAGVAGVTLAGGSASSGPATATAELGATEHAGLDWVMDDEVGLAQARAEGKPVVIDFYADWCAACKELDHKTWVDEDVREEAERFVAIKLDFTERNEWSKAKTSEYRIPGLPTVIFLDSEGREADRFFGFRGPDAVLESMRSVR